MDREEMRKAFEEWARSHNWQEEAIAERPMNGALQALHDIYVAGWQAAMAHSCEVLRNELHRDIMNLPCAAPDNRANSSAVAYQQGHRDARHAAAELALSALSRHGG